jgi:dTDP-4-dehydrorhamnose reductase
MSKLVILGSAGALGNELSKLFRSHQPKLWDQKEVDITDHESLQQKLREFQPDIVINCAAYNNLDKAETEPDLANKINGHAVGSLAKICRELACVVVHFSTNYVFDGTQKSGYNEEDVPSPQSVYAASKYLGEQELQRNTDKFYLLRTAWLYGKAGNSPMSKKNFVDTMLELAQTKTEIDCVADQFAQPTSTVDLAAAVQQLIKQKEPFGIYHLTNSGSASWYTWAKEIFRLKGIEVNLHKTSLAEFAASGHTAARPQHGILNNTKFPPLRSWQEALTEYLRSQ